MKLRNIFPALDTTEISTVLEKLVGEKLLIEDEICTPKTIGEAEEMLAIAAQDLLERRCLGDSFFDAGATQGKEFMKRINRYVDDLDSKDRDTYLVLNR